MAPAIPSRHGFHNERLHGPVQFSLWTIQPAPSARRYPARELEGLWPIHERRALI
jgi:hypothetical protein